jgi:hypothetical protein
VNPLQLRRRQDLERVRALCAGSRGRLVLVAADGDAPSELRLRARLRVALDRTYPSRAGEEVALQVTIPAGYPLRERPRTRVTPVVWHPNVFADGVVCQGRGGQVSEYLDLYVQRILRILSFQPGETNLGSVANAAAAHWYAEARARHPGAFPTDALEASSPAGAAAVRWTDVDR